MSDEEGSNSGSDGEEEEGSSQRRARLPTWQPVDLDSASGVAPSRARAPQLHMLANPAPDTHCLQLEGGLCATGESGADGRVHLWGTDGDELDFKRSLAGHSQGVATLSFQASEKLQELLGGLKVGHGHAHGRAAGVPSVHAPAPASTLLALLLRAVTQLVSPDHLLQRESGWLVAGSGGGPVKVWSLERCVWMPALWLCCKAALACRAVPALLPCTSCMGPPHAASTKLHPSRLQLCRGKLVHDLRGHAAGVLCHQQSGSALATGGADCALRIWDLRAGRAQAVVPLGSFPYCLQVGK